MTVTEGPRPPLVQAHAHEHTHEGIFCLEGRMRVTAGEEHLLTRGDFGSASRMDRGGAGGMARARSKAWIAATQQIPSLTHLKRMGIVAPPMAGFVACSPEAGFPGAGGMPICDDERWAAAYGPFPNQDGPGTGTVGP